MLLCPYVTLVRYITALKCLSILKTTIHYYKKKLSIFKMSLSWVNWTTFDYIRQHWTKLDYIRQHWTRKAWDYMTSWTS